MLLIIDKDTKKVINNMGRNSMFPHGAIPDLPELPGNQIYVRDHDNSDNAKKIMSAFDCTIEHDEYGSITDVDVIKTLAEHIKEKENDPIIIKEKEKNEAKQQLAELDSSLTRGTEDLIDLLVTKNIIKESDLPTYLSEKINQKKALRDKLKIDTKIK